MKFSEEQLRAITHTYGPGLVIAVPGSGKTTVLLARLKHLKQKLNIDPNRLLTISFSRAAVDTMRERYLAQNPEEIQAPVFSTIHGLGYRIILDYSRLKSIDYKLIEQGDSQQNKYRILKEIYRKYNHHPISDERLESLINALGVLANEGLSPDELANNKSIDIPSFPEIVDTYKEYKQRHKLLDFDDMLTLSFSILKHNPYLREKYRKKFDFIQVDEGQDTSRIQMQLLGILAAPKFNLMVVADDDQAIYSFRGASPKGLFRWKESQENLKSYHLSTNYRSRPPIIKTSTKLITSNQMRFEKNIQVDKSGGQKVSISATRDLLQQYDEVIRILKDAKGSVGILYRNNYSAIGLVESLERHNYDFSIRDRRLSFINNWVVRDLIDFFTLAYDPANLPAFSRIFYKMKGYISRAQIDYLSSKGPQENVFQALLKAPGTRDYQIDYLEELEGLFHTISRRNVSRGIQIILHQLAYDSYIEDFCHRFGRSLAQARYYLETLGNMGKDFTHPNLLWGRLKYIDDLIHAGSAGNNPIYLSTVHSAKGLEYDTVIMVDIAQGQFPYLSPSDHLELFEEERRLFYVAMTRAKEKLHIIWPKSIGQKSEFIKDIEKE